eukprot:TRINITY_DN8291_c0_g3_i9.p2 TRINITY_DN8291_c0_g3~~TRINITY_DN8291_c0_g3_i9.p2  ORF type:complete len:136 (-),score=6.06 TRINITY_DN8291_c0_g3_i9:132-539(-)
MFENTKCEQQLKPTYGFSIFSIIIRLIYIQRYFEQRLKFCESEIKEADKDQQVIETKFIEQFRQRTFRLLQRLIQTKNFSFVAETNRHKKKKEVKKKYIWILGQPQQQCEVLKLLKQLYRAYLRCKKGIKRGVKL